MTRQDAHPKCGEALASPALVAWLGVDASARRCEVCGAPTQTITIHLTPTVEERDPVLVLVDHCSSLLCPTNLEDSPVPGPAAIDGDRAVPASRYA